MVEIGNVLVSLDLFTEYFCCDLQACKGACCIEGDAGAPVTIEEIEKLEEALPAIEEQLTPRARAVIERDGVASVDVEGDLVTSIVNGKECVFSTLCGGVCHCAIEKAFLKGETAWRKPASCYLYPVRVRRIGDCDGLNYHRWEICRPAVERGKELGILLYQFLKEPLIARYGKEWYDELLLVAGELKKQHYI